MTGIADSPLFIRGVGVVLIASSMATVISLFIDPSGYAQKMGVSNPLIALIPDTLVGLIAILFTYGMVGGGKKSYIMTILLFLLTLILGLIDFDVITDTVRVAGSALSLALLFHPRTFRYIFPKKNTENEDIAEPE